MNAVATKPRTSAPKAYTRPVQTYSPAIGKTADERLATVRAVLQAADAKLEMAYDSAERGSAIEQLLDLINHDLMCRAAHPAIMGADGWPAVDSAHIARTHFELFAVLAALEGAMALSVGTGTYSTLADAFNLLSFVQDECGSEALGELVPDFSSEEAFNRGRDLAIEMLKTGLRLHAGDTANAQRIHRPVDQGGNVPAQHQFIRDYLEKVVDEDRMILGFSAVLSAALSEDAIFNPDAYRVPMAEYQAGKPGDDGTEPVEADEARTAATQGHPEHDAARLIADESDPRTRIAEALAVLCAAAREHGCAEVWGVHSLAALIERTFDSANPEDADELQGVSNLLEQVLAVIEKVNTDALDCMLMHASASLLTTAKQLVDDRCEAIS